MKTKLAIVAVSVAALGAAGAGTAYASTHSPSVRPVHTQAVPAPAEAPGTEVADTPGSPDVQQGDQNTPDTATSAETSTEQAGAEKASAVDAPGGPDVQQGDQNTPDTATSTEQAGSEKAGSETAGDSDGPGGHADPVGSNADTQQEGEH